MRERRISSGQLMSNDYVTPLKRLLLAYIAAHFVRLSAAWIETYYRSFDLAYALSDEILDHILTHPDLCLEDSIYAEDTVYYFVLTQILARLHVQMSKEEKSTFSALKFSDFFSEQQKQDLDRMFKKHVGNCRIFLVRIFLIFFLYGLFKYVFLLLNFFIR